MSNLLQMCTQFHVKEAVLVENDKDNSAIAGLLQYFLTNGRNHPYNLLCLQKLLSQSVVLCTDAIPQSRVLKL